MKTRKHYYLCHRGTEQTVWHCTHETMSRTISRGYSLILPLERKPRNTEIKEG